MKVLRDTDWDLIGFQRRCAFKENEPVFLFQHRKFRDVLVLNEAKYIDVMNNIVVFCRAKAKQKVCVSGSNVTSKSDKLVRDLKAKCGL